MNIQQFQYVLAVASLQHFEKAAEQCCITQSTLSTMVSKFEEEIGVKIFDRKRKPVLITKEGEVIIANIKTILLHIEHLKVAIKEMKNEVEGTLKIAIIPTVSPFLLPLFLQDFAAKYPSLQIEVTEQSTQNIVNQIKNRVIDIGIVSIPLNDAELEETMLYDEPFLYFDANPTKKKKAITQKDTFDNLWLLEEGHCMRTQVLKLCELNRKELNASLNIKFKAASIDSLLRIVKANQGSTFLPYLATTDFSEADRKNLVPFATPIPIRTIGLITHPFFVKKKVIDLLKAELLQKVTPLLPLQSSVNQLKPV